MIHSFREISIMKNLWMGIHRNYHSLKSKINPVQLKGRYRISRAKKGLIRSRPLTVSYLFWHAILNLDFFKETFLFIQSNTFYDTYNTVCVCLRCFYLKKSEINNCYSFIWFISLFFFFFFFFCCQLNSVRIISFK